MGLYDNPFFVVEGIAFIIVGGVGLVMSWTTMDVGNQLKKSVLKDGRKSRKYLKKIVASQAEMKSSLTEMTSILKRIEAKL